MDLAYRLLTYLVVLVGPTLLFLGLLRGLRWLRDDALLLRIAERDDVSPAASRTAADAVDARPVRADGGGPTADSVACPTCGETNRSESTYCRECVANLR